MSVQLTPLDDIVTPPSRSEHAQLIADLDALPKKAAQFVVPYADDDLRKYKKALQTAANRFNLSVKFGVDVGAPEKGSTVVQAKLVPKQTAAGRPVVGPAVVAEPAPEESDATTA